MSARAAIASQRKWRRIPAWAFTNSKFQRILELCRGKDVLDCGCVGSPIEDVAGMSATSHFQIAKVAQRCVGVDIDDVEIQKRQKMSYQVRVANVETMDLGESFDVIVAADIIEHLSNAGQFLERARAHLRPAGKLCIVTPNPSSTNTVLKALAGIRVAINPEHTCWYDPDTLRQLLRRYGFEPIECYWQDYQKRGITTVLTRIRPSLSAHFIMISQHVEDRRP